MYQERYDTYGGNFMACTDIFIIEWEKWDLTMPCKKSTLSLQLDEGTANAGTYLEENQGISYDV